MKVQNSATSEVREVVSIGTVKHNYGDFDINVRVWTFDTGRQLSLAEMLEWRDIDEETPVTQRTA